MAGLTLLVLFQTGAIIYLVYRVNRLEQMLNVGARPARRGKAGSGEHKVIPLLKEHIAPGPFRGKSNPPPSEPE
ncbi:MAG: hypothetical protein ACOY94_00240 [Bacillota bacterium]